METEESTRFSILLSASVTSEHTDSTAGAKNVRPGSDGAHNNDDTIEAMPTKDISTTGSLEPETGDETLEQMNPVDVDESNKFTQDGVLEAFSSAVLIVEATELNSLSPNSTDENVDSYLEPPTVASASPETTPPTSTEDKPDAEEDDAEDEVPEVTTKIDLVCGDCGGSTINSCTVDIVSAPASSDIACIDTMDTTEAMETPTTASNRAVEPPSDSSASQSKSKTTGSPLKGHFRTPKFNSPQKPKKQYQEPSHGPALILSLPIDSLHTIASFLSPIEWTYFGQCDRGTNRICNEIFRRVRMHGFRCATEVVTAWKLGQHADAKELCALYVHAGVPIYPSCLGHSYDTLVWRLGVEAKHLQELHNPGPDNLLSTQSSGNPAEGGASNGDRSLSDPANVGANDAAGAAAAAVANGSINDSEQIPPVDPFYAHREETRTREGSMPDPTYGLSYLEEKALYTMNVKDEESDMDGVTRAIRRQISISNPLHRLPVARHTVGGQRGNQQPAQPQHQFAPFVGHPPPEVARWGSMVLAGRDGGLGGANRRQHLTRSNSFTDLRFRPAKVLLKIHRHLLDQHLLGRESLNDNDGTITTPPVSLSADFFHPFFSFRSSAVSDQVTQGHSISSSPSNGQSSVSTFATNDAQASRYLLPAWNHPNAFPAAASGAASAATSIPRMQLGGMEEATGEEVDVPEEEALIGTEQPGVSEGVSSTDDSDSDADAETGPVPRPTLMETTHGIEIDNQQSIRRLPPVMQPPLPRSSVAAILSDHSPSETMIDHPVSFQNNILANVDLDVYSASSGNAKMEGDNVMCQQLRSRLKTRFAVYHRRLEKHLWNNDSAGFEECILDFWDEFLPQTAYIHYYDKHTAVPRVSCLHKFLTRPCSKAIGTIQCEIERIKVGSKKKGVSMKGRFFPTYEYRLFVRHRPADPTNESTVESSTSKTPRRDTVLMIAKHRGRKHSEIAGKSSVTSASKKGSNNYYLYLPQQEDVELHYSSVNSLEAVSRPISNGPGLRGVSHDPSSLLGRLQSNFIGTEFQIFTPRVCTLKPKPLTTRSMTVPSTYCAGVSSDEDVIYDGAANAEFPSTLRRRSRFGRLSLRGRGHNHDPQTIVEDGLAEPHDNVPSALSLRRSWSSGDMTPGRKSRPSRRVSAAEALETHHHYSQQPQPSFVEEEDGAITYTANLLGSRPRIMDVCIPKVGSDGQGMEWKRYIENCEDHDLISSPNRMLNHLKQLQQRIDGEEGGRLTGPGINSETRDSDDRYSPPDDFGLLALQNRPPWWNVELGSFVLNFGGRVSVASVKNFQLCDRSDQDYVMLQFGRIQGRHSFTMDFQYPLTAVQAFAIAISSLQSKISFG